MNYRLSRLYGLKSKKKLFEWLGVNSPSFFNNRFFLNYHPYIDDKNGKKRLIESSSQSLNRIQKRILSMLRVLDLPSYLFSGIKGKSYINNARQHEGQNFVFKVDISKFFPNTSREKVYNFFLNKLQTSKDIAKILTDCTTVDLRKYSKSKNYTEILKFLDNAKIRQISHLSTGAPTSMLLSFLANQSMFDAINEICSNEKCILSVYADDITISSKNAIIYKVRERIIKIIESYGYSISKKKQKYIKKIEYKIVTGTVINKKGTISVPNKLIRKTHDKILKYKRGSLDNKELQSLKGCVNAANQINGSFYHFKNILYDKNDKIK